MVARYYLLMDSRFTQTLQPALARLTVHEGPYCSCRNGCRLCVVEVEHDDHERIIRCDERLGVECPCGERCSGETFALDGVAYCSLECTAYALLCEHTEEQDQSDAARDAMIAAIKESFALEALHAAANRAALYVAGTRETVRPGAAA